MKHICLNIPLGYTIREETLTVSIEQAQEWLLTRKQKKYTCAQRGDFTVALTRHYIRCPYCNYKTYAYAREMNKAFDCGGRAGERVGKERVRSWTSQQTTLFEDERAPLCLTPVVEVASDLICPHCKNTMHPSDQTRRVELAHVGHKIWIRAEVLDVMELLSLPCLFDGAVRLEFPLFEAVCFNFRNGHTYVRLETAEGRCLTTRDVTADKYAWTAGAVYDAIAKSKYVRRVVGRMFRHEWRGALPFYPSELGVDELRMLTMFVGYKRPFYSTIPFEKSTLAVDASFRLQARRMRHARDVVSLYEQAQLPSMKSVRKVFFENEGLFFYLPECERLWALFNDPNHFVALLKGKDAYQILSDLHMRPMMFTFLHDYLTVVSKQHLLKRMHKYWYSVCRYAVNYGSMSDSMRKRERDKWQKHQRGSAIGNFPAFAIPMCTPTERIRDCTIDEFTFSWLKTSADYEEAGKALRNCLTEWSTHNYPVVCVRKAGKIIAALEVRNHFVYQARTANNNGLDAVPGLRSAYRKWHAKNHLSRQYVPLPGADYDYRHEVEDDEDFPL